MISNRRLRIIASVTSAIIAVSFALAPAARAEGSALSADEQMAQMELRYGSLAGAMQISYAQNRGMGLASFLAGNPGQLANLTGLTADDPKMKTLLAQLGAGSSITDLDSALSQSGLTLSSNAYRSVSNAALEIRAKASTLDAAVVQAGMSWAATMVSLRAPELAIPTAPQLDTTAVTGMPAEGLAFGMFTNRALNAFVRGFPDVFGQVSASGIGSNDQMKAWNSSIKTAMKASSADLSTMLGDGCGSAFLAGLAGNTYAGSCSPCVAAGRLANGQLQLIFDPSAASVIPNNADNALSPAEWQNLTPAQREALAAQNSSVSSVLSSATPNTSSTGCSAASSAVKRNVTATVPSILDYLGGP